MRESDSVIEDFMVSVSHVKDENKIGAKCLSKVWSVDNETYERTLGVVTQRRTRLDNPSLEKRHSENHIMLRCKRLDE